MKEYHAMTVILPNILTLITYQSLLKNSCHALKPNYCPSCQYGTLWCHGYYERKANRINQSHSKSNSIKIMRFYCPSCRQTCSVLPECLPERRWYLWDTQQVVMTLFLQGYSFKTIATLCAPSRRTIGRWIQLFQAAHDFISHSIRSIYPEFGYYPGFTDFWIYCFSTLSLSFAMWLIGGWFQVLSSLK